MRSTDKMSNFELVRNVQVKRPRLSTLRFTSQEQGNDVQKEEESEKLWIFLLNK